MPYLIDGHNLIAKTPGLSLSAPDDEMELVGQLQEFCRRWKKQVEVYFDNAPPGQPQRLRFGPVSAHFVRQGRTADEAIQKRLKRLGRAARNWTVVSSDRQVQAAAREARAQVLSSEDFARQMMSSPPGHGSDNTASEDFSLGPGELDEWLDLFGEGETSE